MNSAILRKLKFQLIILTISLILYCVNGIGVLKASDEWPMLKNDMAHSAVNFSDSLQTPLSLQWTSSVTIGANNTVAYSSPVMWNGKTYIGGVDGTFYAFAGSIGTQTNAPLWTYKTLGMIYGSAAVTTLVVGGQNQDYVYVGTTEGNFYCFNASATSGPSLVWSQTVGGAIFTSPVIVPESGVTLVICASHSGQLTAMNAQTGAVVWTASPSTNYFFASPAYDTTNDLVYEPSYDGNLYALRAQTGLLDWNTPVSVGPTRASPAVTNSYVYNLSNSGILTCVNKATGVVKAKASIGSPASASPAAFRSTGATSDTIVTCGLSGTVAEWTLADSASNFVQVWQKPLGAAINSSPAIAGPNLASALVYVGCNNGNLYALNLTTGIQSGSSISLGKTVQIAPAVAEGKLLISSSNGNFQVYSNPTATATMTPTMTVTLTPTPTSMGDIVLPGHVISAIQTATPVGTMSDSTTVNLAIGLPFRDQAGLDSFLNQLYDSKSSMYRRFLKPQEITERFGPTQKDYQDIIDFVKSSGLVVTNTYPHRLLVDVSGPVSLVRRVFNVRLNNYQRSDGTEFYATSDEPSLPGYLQITHITGLDNFNRPTHKPIRNSRNGTSKPKSNIGTGTGNDVGGLYQGQDFRNVYAPDVPANVTGAGQTVGLMEFDGFYPDDITYYQTHSNPSFTAPTPIIVPVNNTPVVPSSNFEGVGEVSLDIEMVNSIAPGAQVKVFEAPATMTYATAADDLFALMVNDSTCSQFSTSWGGYGDINVENAMNQMAAQGQALFISAGDNGSYVTGGKSGYTNVTEDEALYQSKWETIVGGTILTTTNPTSNSTTISYLSETTWNQGNGAGGGGICVNVQNTPVLAIPTWQAPVNMSNNSGSTSARNFPDVSMVADSILLVAGNYADDPSQGYKGSVGGTSASAPLWAGFCALINQESVAAHSQAVGNINPNLYIMGLGSNYGRDFNDIADSSSNFYYWYPGASSQGLSFVAVTGYDLATGWGSPKGQNAIYDLVGNMVTFTPTPTSSVPTATRTMTPTVSMTFTITMTPSQTPTSTMSATNTVTVTPNGTSLCSVLGNVVTGNVLGVALDGSGNIYATDDLDTLVSIYSSSGTLLKQWGTEGTALGQFENPTGIALDGKGQIYVVDSDNNRVQVFSNLSNQASLINNWGSTGIGNMNFQYPVGIAISPVTGLIYVVDSGNSRVEVFNLDINGNPQYYSQLSVPNGASTFVTPWGVATDNAGRVYVTDNTNSLISVFDLNNNFLEQWDPTAGSGGLLGAEFITVDNQGVVYVSDGFGSVGLYDTIGDWLNTQTNNPVFESAEGLAYSSGMLAVADAGNGSVDLFGSCNVSLNPTMVITSIATPFPTSTSTITASPTNTSTYTMTATSTTTTTGTATSTSTSTMTGTKTLTSTKTGTFTRTSTSSPTQTGTITLILTSTQTSTSTPTLSGTFTNTCTITLTGTPSNTPTINYETATPNCGVMYQWLYGSAIAALTQVPFTSTPSTGTPTSTPTAIPFRPQGVAVANNNVYVADSGSKNLQVYSVKAGTWSDLGLSSRLNIQSLTGLSVDGRGVVYMADGGSTYVYAISTPNPTSNTRDIYALNLGSMNPSDIWSSSMGTTLLVSSYNSIYVYQTDWWVAGATFPVEQTITIPGTNFSGITVDKAGYLYAVDSLNKQVLKFSPSNPGAPNGLYSSTPVTLINSGLTYPQHLALDPQNNLYVTDNSGFFSVFNSGTGQFIYQVHNYSGANGFASGNLINPTGIAVDANWNVYVGDPGNLGVAIFQACPWKIQTITMTPYTPAFSATFTYTPTPSSTPSTPVCSSLENVNGNYTGIQGVVVVGQNYWFAYQGLIAESSLSGGGATAWTLSSNLYGLGTDGTNVYVTGKNGSSGAIYKVSGVLNSTTSSYINASDTAPRGIWSNSEGTTQVVADGGSVFVYSGLWSGSGQTDQTISLPSGSNAVGVAVDSSGNLYVSDSANNRVLKFGAVSGGTFSTSSTTYITGLNQPAYLAFDSSGDLYVSNTAGGDYSIYGITGSTGTFICSSPSSLPGYSSVNQPEGISVDSNLNVYLADSGNNRIDIFNPFNLSHPTFTFTNTPTITLTPTFTLTPTYTFTPSPTFSNSNYLCSAGTPVTMANPYALAFDSENDLYVTDNVDNQVDVFNSSGQMVGSPIGGTGTALLQFTDPEGVAVDGSGNIYVSDSGNNRIEVLNNSGSSAVAWGNIPYLYNNTSAAPHGWVQYPAGIAVGGSPVSVFVADSGNSRIQVFDTNGTYLTSWGYLGTMGNGTFDTPWGVALDNQGYVYVTDIQTDIVQKFTASGHFVLQWNTTNPGTNLLGAEFIGVANGVVYVSDGYGSVGLYDTMGNYIGFTQGSNPALVAAEGLAVLPGSNPTSFAVADPVNGLIEVLGSCIQLTSTPTVTQTSTLTNTQTVTQTFTWTNTATSSWTSTATSTVSNTQTSTPTNTPTNTTTVTVTNTNTQTFTSTNTVTNSPTSTATSTVSNTQTATPTNTPTNTATETVTNTNTQTFTQTPTFTPTAINISGLLQLVAYSDGSESNKATVMGYNGSAWIPIGTPGISSGAATWTSLAIASSTPYVAYSDGSDSGKAVVKSFNGTSWVTVGSSDFSPGTASYLSLAMSGSNPYLAFEDSGHGNKATVMEYNGSSWVTVGSAGFSPGVATYESLSMSGSTPYVAFEDGGHSNKATVMEYNGSSWVTVGSPGFSSGTATYLSLAMSGSTPYVAYSDGGNSSKATVMEYNGSSWAVVGSAAFSAGPVTYVSLAMSGSTPYVAYSDGSSANAGKATVMEFNGTSWASVLSSSGFSSGTALYTSLSILNGTPYVAYEDAANGNKATVQQANFTDWSPEGSADFSGGAATYLSLVNTGVSQLSTNTCTNTSTVVPSATITMTPTATPTPINISNFSELIGYSDGANSNKATVMGYNGSSWVTIGNAGFSPNSVTWMCSAIANGVPYVAFADGSGAKAMVMNFNGNSWVTTGAADFSAGGTSYLSLATYGNTPYLAYTDAANGGKATVVEFNGTTWEPLGTIGFSPSVAVFMSLAISSGTPYLAYLDTANGSKGTVMKFNGSSWSSVGSVGFTTANPLGMTLAMSGSTPYVAYQDYSNGNKAMVMDYNGSSWVTVGSPDFSSGAVTYVSLAMSGSTPYVAYQDVSNSYKATVMDFNGTSWVPVGTPGFTSTSVQYTSLAINGGVPYLAYGDNDASVMSFNGSSWNYVGSSNFSAGVAQYISLNNVGTATPTPTNTPGGGPMVVRAFSKSLEGSRSLTTTPTMTATSTVTPTLTPTFTPTSSSLLLSAVAAPNISKNGMPIDFHVKLGQPGQITLTLYTILGEQSYQTTVEGNVGDNQILWNLRNRSRCLVGSGLYICVIEIQNGLSSTKQISKIIVLH